MSPPEYFEKHENLAFTSPSPSTTTSTLFRRPARVTFKVILPSRFCRLGHRRIPAQATVRGPTRRGGACFTRDLGLTSRTFSLDVRARPSRDRHRSHPAERGSPPLRPGRESPSRSSAPRTWGECQPFRRARSKPLRCRSAVRRRISRSAIRGHTRSPPCRCDGISSPARAHYATLAHCPPLCSRWVFNSALEPSFVRDNPAILRDRRRRDGQGHGGNPRSIAKDIAPDAGRGRNHQTTWPRSAQPRQVSTTT